MPANAERMRVATGDVVGLEDEDAPPASCEQRGPREPGHARADDEIVEVFVQSHLPSR
jgi:hypothetical protein